MNAESSQLGIRSGKKRGKKPGTDPHNEEDGKSSQLDDTCFLIIYKNYQELMIMKIVENSEKINGANQSRKNKTTHMHYLSFLELPMEIGPHAG